MLCDVCGRDGARERRLSRTYGRGKRLLVIEEVPVVVCPHCGESYVTAETARELSHIRRHASRLAVPRSIGVATFAWESKS
ncbi:MAG: type II toxin-antitoxin system MqsA family antitoxin [Candidatus Riflebacteria bacterium]|nr:type II toxin-antitoxin system MqsA family antitoxin [Candidatus Riflebacteria bacterium]